MTLPLETRRSDCVPGARSDPKSAAAQSTPPLYPEDSETPEPEEPVAERPPRTQQADSGIRRQLLKWITAAGFSVIAMPLLLSRERNRSQFTGSSAENGQRVRRWVMAIDLRRCDGCQGIDEPPQCTQACIEGHLAPEPMEWIQVYERELPLGGTQFVPTPCQHCQNAPCLNVCPVGATFATPEGVILIDQDRCIGCRICMAACPYDRRFFNWGDAPVPPESQLVNYHVDHQIPAQRGTVMKCDLCPDMARVGKLPYCAQACPTNAIYYGDLEEDIATNGEEVVKFSRFLAENNAYRLNEELGTRPRVYYIPGGSVANNRSKLQAGRIKRNDRLRPTRLSQRAQR